LMFGAPLPSQAAQQIAVGKAVGPAWTFLPLNVGKEHGIFARYGLGVNILNFRGDASLQQGLASNSIALGLGSGPAMAFAAKGAPVIAVAAFYGAPRNMALSVAENSPIKSAKDLKGKTIGVTTQGSLTQWLVERVSLAEGWGKGGITALPIGGVPANIAAMRAGETDGLVGSFETGATLEAKHQGRILLRMGKYAPVFITHVVFARKTFAAQHPDLVSRFLKGFFATIAFERTHKEDTVKAAERVLHMTPAIAEKTYDQEIGGYETGGTFNLKAVAILKRSYVDLGILPTEPKNSQLFTTRFVPVKLALEHGAESVRR
ncbi:MAG: ABC transporter substrate-binding protein, partial [Stellaceae bacterium]